MKREILFRGKRLDNGEWIEGGYRHEKVGEYVTAVFIIEPLTSGVWESHRVDPETVGQYTGLEDKNGRKIFEDDIITVNGHGDFLLYVAFDRNEWAGKSKRHPYYRCHLDFRQESYEVIGNIHDNPELLEVEE